MYTSLKNMQAYNVIIIKVADKGSAVVILNKTYYITRIQEILRYKTNYEFIQKWTLIYEKLQNSAEYSMKLYLKRKGLLK